jgi:hypothetical protein
MDVLNMVYPRYWLGFNLKSTLNVIKAFYCELKKCAIGFVEVCIPLVLDYATLDLQHFLFVSYDEE